ncbi:MAG: magnesium chelatase subunit D [Pseudomonadota bacterium]
MSPGQAAWARACLALKLLAAEPTRLRGLTLRARSGPVRDMYLDGLHRLLGPIRKLHPAMSRDALLGGLDFTQTLATGKLTASTGLLETPGTCVLTMAERCPPDIAALIAAQLDAQLDLTLILLDEGAEPDEGAPAALVERVAFDVSLDGIGRLEATPAMLVRSNTRILSKDKSPKPRKTPMEVTELTRLAARLGIDTLRPPQFAMHAARLHAALNGRGAPDAEDLRVATELVLAPRAIQVPEPEQPEPETPSEQPEQTRNKTQSETLPQDMLIEAVRAVLPENLLENLRNSDASRGKGSGAGQRKRGNRRGRPLPSRPGRLDGTSRIDLVATLRTAAPWQTLRGKQPGGPIRVFPSDIHLKRFEDKSDRLIIFAVDASGSSALARLGEAKGAVELLLSRAYATRDHVALIAFRGDEAQLLLPPTRSLVQTKRRLAELPGGGGTPLARGLQAAAMQAESARHHGLSPTLAILTDGRANIALDGRGNREQAGQDARSMARWIRSMGVPAIVLDLGTRPQPALATLAREMAGTYLPLPRANAERMSKTLGAAFDHGLGA